MAVEKIQFTAGAPLYSYQASIIIPILTEAFRRNGIYFSVTHNPSLRSLKLSNSGWYDGELHRVFDFHQVTEGEYHNLIRIDEEILSVWIALFATYPITVKQLADLNGYRLVYYRGRMKAHKLLKQALYETSWQKVYRVNNDGQAFAMLAAGRADIVISESRLGHDLIKCRATLLNIDEIAKIRKEGIFSYMHKKHKKLALAIADSLRQMKQDGSFARIFAQAEQAYLARACRHN